MNDTVSEPKLTAVVSSITEVEKASKETEELAERIITAVTGSASLTEAPSKQAEPPISFVDISLASLTRTINNLNDIRRHLNKLEL